MARSANPCRGSPNAWTSIAGRTFAGRKPGPDRDAIGRRGYSRISLNGKRTESNYLKKTLFLSPPSFDGFDGGAGARYQAKREITSYWFPTWLAQPAALVRGSKLIDAPPHRQTVEDILAVANDYELFILHTSTPSLNNDIRCAEAIKAKNSRA